MSTQTAATFDFAALKRAIEGRDASGMLAAYAPDAEVTLVDQQNPPSRPTVLRGEQIRAWIEDVCGRDMTHSIEREVLGGERASFAEVCHYPDGTDVLMMAALEVRDGRIVRQLSIQAWDT
jgi:ketosteroid isomerase-like protein